ncbi:MAG: adenylyl-sulfate kinase, partial [Planctomycetaceae bacterium]
DNVRMGLNASPAMLESRHGSEFATRFGLSFAPQDREENVRRVAAVAALLADAGIVTLAAFVSPYRRDRQLVRDQLKPGDFVEVFVKAPLEVCESRDPKGLYKKARSGQLQGFTGIDAPYEEPLSAELVVDSTLPADRLAVEVIGFLERAGVVPHGTV